MVSSCWLWRSLLAAYYCRPVPMWLCDRGLLWGLCHLSAVTSEPEHPGNCCRAACGGGIIRRGWNVRAVGPGRAVSICPAWPLAMVGRCSWFQGTQLGDGGETQLLRDTWYLQCHRRRILSPPLHAWVCLWCSEWAQQKDWAVRFGTHERTALETFFFFLI